MGVMRSSALSCSRLSSEIRTVKGVTLEFALGRVTEEVMLTCYNLRESGGDVVALCRTNILDVASCCLERPRLFDASNRGRHGDRILV